MPPIIGGGRGQTFSFFFFERSRGQTCQDVQFSIPRVEAPSRRGTGTRSHMATWGKAGREGAWQVETCSAVPGRRLVSIWTADAASKASRESHTTRARAGTPRTRPRAGERWCPAGRRPQKSKDRYLGPLPQSARFATPRHGRATPSFLCSPATFSTGSFSPRRNAPTAAKAPPPGRLSRPPSLSLRRPRPRTASVARTQAMPQPQPGRGWHGLGRHGARAVCTRGRSTRGVERGGRRAPVRGL
jgi:uncharacterized protein YndB with AHSA1/START domain